MKLSSVRRQSIALVSLTLATALVACGEDKRVKELNSGITRDSAVSILAQDAKNATRDSFPNVYTRDQYIIEGKNYEVLYFTPENRKFAVGDSVHLRDLTPIVFVNNLLVGKGWPAWDSIAAAHKIPVVNRSAK